MNSDQAQERLALALANSTSDFLFVVDEAGRLRYANPAFCKCVLAGKAADGQDLFATVDQASAERGRDSIAAALAARNGESTQVELFHFEADGRARPVFYTLSRVESGVAAVGRDKTADLELLGEIVQLNIQLEEKQTALADANARLEQMAVTDQITGLYNRHHFFTVIKHLFEEARRYSLPLCCFMLDADNFKVLNDTYGHLFGDHVLRMAADRLRRNTRRSDVLARYGGEEFIMVAPNTDRATATVLAERLRASVADEPYTLGSVKANVTMSVGLASTEVVTAGPFDDLLGAADRALYQAKLAGRNRCEVYQPGMAPSLSSGGAAGGAAAGRKIT